MFVDIFIGLIRIHVYIYSENQSFKMTTTRLSTATAEIILRDDGIAEFSALPTKTGEFTLDEIIEVLELIQPFTQSHRKYLVEIKHGKYSHEARKYIASQEVIADKVAMVATGPFQKMMGNFFLGLNKPNIEIKLFNQRKNAEEWLLQ